MKTNIYTLILLMLFSSCESKEKNLQEHLSDVKEDFSKQAEINNAKILAWEHVIDSIYKLADTNKFSSIHFIDELLKNTTPGSQEIYDLHFIKGDIYYRIDSLQKALNEFSASINRENFSSPKLLAARAGVYVKLKQFDNAFNDLTKAAEVNYDYYWNIGNYYEIIGQKDSALLNYQKLYQRDTIIYKECKGRITELKKDKPKFLTELIYRDRERWTLLMNGVK